MFLGAQFNPNHIENNKCYTQSDSVICFVCVSQKYSKDTFSSFLLKHTIKKSAIMYQSLNFFENKILALNLRKLTNYVMDSAKSYNLPS